jgi:hypothetical protein
MEHAYLLPYTNDICRTIPVTVYHTVTQTASQTRIQKQLRDLFPTASESNLRILKQIVHNVLHTEECEEAWEVRIENYGHTLLALRNTEHTLQPVEKRQVFHVVMENMELYSWDGVDAAVLVLMYFIGFWVSWFLQLYIKAPMATKPNCDTCFPRHSSHWLLANGPYF